MTENLGREPAVILETRSRVRDVHLGFDNWFATVARFELGEHSCFLANPVRKLEKQPATLLSSGVGPGSLFESFTRGPCSTVDICFSCIRHLRDDLFRGRVVYGKPCPIRTGHALAIDVHSIAIHKLL